VIGEKLELEEAEEPKECGIWWDVRSINEDKGIVHLGLLLIEGWSDCMFVIFHY